MLKKTVISGLILLSTLCSVVAKAEVSAAEILAEADRLVEIVPERSKKIAQKILAEISRHQEHPPSPREEVDNLLHAPNINIFALQVLAKANYTLGDIKGALTSIEQAESLARTYQLSYLQLTAQLLKAEFLWKTTRDKSQLEPLLTEIEAQTETKKNKISVARFTYKLLIIKAEIAAEHQNDHQALNYYSQAEKYLVQFESVDDRLRHQITQAQYYLSRKVYSQALYRLLSGYWLAIEENKPILLAKINRFIAQLFLEKSAYDKALEHLSQAADLYDNYPGSAILSDTLKSMADIYYVQGKYNLALVHYFNLLDSDATSRDIEKLMQARLEVAKTYLRLYNYPSAEQFLQRADALLPHIKTDRLHARSLLIHAELELLKKNADESITYAQDALIIGRKMDDHDVRQQAHLLLTEAYALTKNYRQAYENSEKYKRLVANKQNRLSVNNESDVLEQKSLIEQSLHYKDQTQLLELRHEEQAQFKYTVTTLLILLILVLIPLLYRGVINRKMKKQLSALYKDYYTHPRSGLRNFRLLNVNLPSSLKQSSAHFEQWKSGELINEPLHDKLRFVMFELPCMRTCYLQQGYNAGLGLESKFGKFIKTKLESPARLYHFADGMFLYVEPEVNPNKTVSELFEQVYRWIHEFEPKMNLDRTIRAGIAEYPFLPKAYTAINDKELIDILLMASNLARLQNHLYGGSQWVSLRAIENAPAASFVSEDIRSACLSAIENGLIKIESSEKVEDSTIKLTVLE